MNPEKWHICERCGQRYSDADGSCEKCAPCSACGELADVDEIYGNDGECDDCAGRCHVCWEEPKTTEFNAVPVCAWCCDELREVRDV